MHKREGLNIAAALPNPNKICIKQKRTDIIANVANYGQLYVLGYYMVDHIGHNIN